ncbi:MAG: ATP-binding cassette domain-containing protein [Nocardioides sp.]
MTTNGGDGRQDGRLVGTDLSFDVDGRRVLDTVSMAAEPGRMLAVTGSSGSGKTTLLALVGGLAKPTTGAATYDGRPVTTKGGEPLSGTGFVLQSYGLVPTLTASENVSIALRGRGVGPKEATDKAVEALGRVGVDELADRLISELSGGQLQRVAVARALVVQADVLLADEPTSELDEANRDVVVGQLRVEANRGAVVLLATHDPAVAEECDDEIHLVDGRIEVAAAPAPPPEPGHENDMYMRPSDEGDRR